MSERRLCDLRYSMSSEGIVIVSKPTLSFQNPTITLGSKSTISNHPVSDLAHPFLYYHSPKAKSSTVVYVTPLLLSTAHPCLSCPDGGVGGGMHRC